MPLNSSKIENPETVKGNASIKSNEAWRAKLPRKENQLKGTRLWGALFSDGATFNPAFLCLPEGLNILIRNETSLFPGDVKKFRIRFWNTLPFYLTWKLFYLVTTVL